MASDVNQYGSVLNDWSAYIKGCEKRGSTNEA
jgi:hypothetical protein